MSSSDDDSENTRFPCLATVRYAIATVVGVVAVTVAIMVIIVVRRPQEIRLSVYHGYIRGYRDGSTLQVNFRFNNPSGRGDIDCSDITVRVLDVNGTDIVQFELDRFSVPVQTTLTVMQRVPINDTRQQTYIRDRYYSEEDSFRVAVVVRASLRKKSSNEAAMRASHSKKSSNAAASEGHPIKRTFYCWPVSVRFFYFYYSSLYSYSTDDVACIKSADGEIPQQNSFTPAPAPAIESG